MRDDSFEKDFDALIAHLTANASSLGIDRDRIALYAGSGNVSRALPLVQNPKQTVVRAAVMYYRFGAGQRVPARPSDPHGARGPRSATCQSRDRRPRHTGSEPERAAYAAQLRRWSPAFEIVDDEDATRDVIDTTIEFVKRRTAPTYQASLRRALPEATAAAHVASGNFAAAAASYAELVKVKPDDARMRLSFGEALLGASQFAEACTELEKLKGKGLGPRDLGVPVARACMQKGDAEAALLAQIDPAAFSPAQSREGSDLCPDSEPPRVQGPVSVGRMTSRRGSTSITQKIKRYEEAHPGQPDELPIARRGARPLGETIGGFYRSTRAESGKNRVVDDRDEHEQRVNRRQHVKYGPESARPRQVTRLDLNPELETLDDEERAPQASRDPEKCPCAGLRAGVPRVLSTQRRPSATRSRRCRSAAIARRIRYPARPPGRFGSGAGVVRAAAGSLSV